MCPCAGVPCFASCGRQRWRLGALPVPPATRCHQPRARARGGSRRQVVYRFNGEEDVSQREQGPLKAVRGELAGALAKAKRPAVRRWLAGSKLGHVPLLAGSKHRRHANRPAVFLGFLDSARGRRRTLRVRQGFSLGPGRSGSRRSFVMAQAPLRRCDWQSSNISPAGAAKMCDDGRCPEPHSPAPRETGGVKLS